MPLPPLKDNNTPQALQRLLQTRQVSLWETLFRAEPYGPAAAVRPSELSTIYTHKLVLRDLHHSMRQTDKLAAVLSHSRFSPTERLPNLRFGMRFYDFTDKVAFEFYTDGSFAVGMVNRQAVSIEGEMTAYLKRFVAAFFAP